MKSISGHQNLAKDGRDYQVKIIISDVHVSNCYKPTVELYPTCQIKKTLNSTCHRNIGESHIQLIRVEK